MMATGEFVVADQAMHTPCGYPIRMTLKMWIHLFTRNKQVALSSRCIRSPRTYVSSTDGTRETEAVLAGVVYGTTTRVSIAPGTSVAVSCRRGKRLETPSLFL